MKDVVIVGSFPVKEYANADLNDEEFEDLLRQNDEIHKAFEEFQVSCRELGKRLAQRNVRIFVGSDRKVDADTYVVEGANQAEGKHQVVVYTPHNWPYPAFIERWSTLSNIDADYWRVPGPWQNSTAHIIRKVDAVFVVGGQTSTLQAGMSAPALCKPVIALTAFKGAAVRIFAAFRWNYTESGMSRDQFQALQQPFTSADQVETILSGAEQFVKKRPYAVATRLGVKIGVLSLVIILIILWGVGLSFGSRQRTTSSAEEPSTAQRTAERVDMDNPNAKPLATNQANANAAADKDQSRANDGAAREPQKAQDADKPDSDAMDQGRDGSSKQKTDKEDATGRQAANGKPVANNGQSGTPAEGDDRAETTLPPETKPSPPPSPGAESETSAGTNEGDGKTTANPAQSAEQQRLAQDIGDSTGWLIFILTISALLGSSLRAGFRMLQDQVVTLGDICNEIIVGLLLSFSLLILYLAAGVLFEGDVLVGTPSNFRRLAVTVSAFALGSAFLLENAANEVRRRFGQTLQR